MKVVEEVVLLQHRLPNLDKNLIDIQFSLNSDLLFTYKFNTSLIIYRKGKKGKRKKTEQNLFMQLHYYYLNVR